MPNTDNNKNAAKKVPIKVGGSSRKQAQGSSQQGDNNSQARKGAIFLGAVVVAYIVYLVFTGQMATFIEALSGVNMHWVAGAALCYVFYFIFGVMAYAIAVYLDHD
jgi:uncharacterized membrane protein YbhN (UPF0104 family)